MTINAYELVNNYNATVAKTDSSTAQRAWEAMVNYVARTARDARRLRIMLCTPADIPTRHYFGYLGRLQYDPAEDKAYYIVGQDGIVEHGVLRDIFDPQKR